MFMIFCGVKFHNYIILRHLSDNWHLGLLTLPTNELTRLAKAYTIPWKPL
jgi:hypothetical protein